LYRVFVIWHDQGNANKGVCVKCILFKYFNETGGCLHQLGIESDGQFDSNVSGSTSRMQGACALQALISQVTTEQITIHFAREVRWVGIEDRKPVAVADVLSELEAKFGAVSVQWARAIFTTLNLRPPTMR
jgi:hypothetical protein